MRSGKNVPEEKAVASHAHAGGAGTGTAKARGKSGAGSITSVSGNTDTGVSLRAVYQRTVEEKVPDDMLALLKDLG